MCLIDAVEFRECDDQQPIAIGTSGFATDYPHWDYDDPTQVLAMPLPEQQRRDFSFNNAIKLNRRAERSADQPDLDPDHGCRTATNSVGGHRG